MAGDSTFRYKAYMCFLDGLTVEECAEKTSIKYGRAKAYYTDFIVESAVIESNDKYSRIRQASAMEKELFECIARFNKRPCAELNNIIKGMQNNYCQFNALA